MAAVSDLLSQTQAGFSFCQRWVVAQCGLRDKCRPLSDQRFRDYCCVPLPRCNDVRSQAK